MDLELLGWLTEIRKAIKSDLPVGCTGDQIDSSPIDIEADLLIGPARPIEAVERGGSIAEIPAQNLVTLPGDREHDLVVMWMELELCNTCRFGSIEYQGRGNLTRFRIM